MEIPGLGFGSPPKPPPNVTVDYQEEITPVTKDDRNHFTVVRFIFEAGAKLEMKPLSQATAAHLYHKVFSECSLSELDPYLIATTALYLAGKVEEDHKRLRDVINVCYRCCHKDQPPLDIGSMYWSLRESVIQTELFILRVLQFQVVVSNPHKYLLHYIKSLAAWLNPDVVSKAPFGKTAWAFLQDSYHGSTCLRYSAEAIAVSVLYFALQCHGVEVPHSDEAEYRWWEAFVEDMQLSEIRKIIAEIIDTYNMETMAAS